jgi:DNA-binding winged helix-turn-helix (wHTH) protein/tetratricopeptide (TPR) repeat protein
MLRFAGFELDTSRVELRHAGGDAIPLRPKTFDLLSMLAARPRQVIGKQDLMAAIWPSVHVGEDSLFQCIRELRQSLGDDSRTLIKSVPGRGYRFDADVEDTEARTEPAPEPAVLPEGPLEPPLPSRRFAWPVILTTIGLVLAALAVASPMLAQTLFPRTPALAVLPLTAAGDGSDGMAANVTDRLIDGLEKVPNLEVTAPASTTAGGDFVLTGTVQRSGDSWTAQARLTRGRANEVVWAGAFSVPAGSDLDLEQSRLAAALGHDLAVRLNTLLNEQAARSADPATEAGKVVVQQANAYINQQTPERFHAAQSMLEDGLARYPGNIDIEVALAAQLLRGVQMVFYSPEENAKARVEARAILEHALSVRPNSVPVHEAYCRLLATTNQFKDALVACARTLTFDPWNGIALYLLGLSELNLGRFDDALATFTLANSYDTPDISRWTWRLGIGWVLMMKDRPAEAIPWLEQSIAITPASGRSYFLLAAAYQAVGRTEDAKAAVAQGMQLRPGTTVANVGVPMENTSPAFATQTDRLMQLYLAAGVPAN